MTFVRKNIDTQSGELDPSKSPQPAATPVTTPVTTPAATPAAIPEAAKRRSAKREIGVKPEKPPDSPLFPHPNGQWAKKIAGKTHYFGSWDDYPAAFKAYKKFLRRLRFGDEDRTQAEEPIVLAGQLERQTGVPPQLPHRSLSVDPHTLDELLNIFLHEKLQEVTAHRITRGTWGNYRQVARFLKSFFGADMPIDTIRAEELAKFRLHIQSTMGICTLARTVNLTRTMLRWAYEVKRWLPMPPDFGRGFGVPPAREKRAAKARVRKDRNFTAEEIRAQLAAAREPLKTWIYLGINGGFGEMDIATLQIEDVDLKRGIIEHSRNKTSIDRALPLWPETLAGLKEAIANRTSGPVFVGRDGRPQVYWKNPAGEKAYRVDHVYERYRKLLRKVDQLKQGRAFYTLRHVFRTIGNNAGDDNTLAWMMGHVREGEGETTYTLSPPYEKLGVVSKYVRDWLLGKITTATENVDFTRGDAW